MRYIKTVDETITLLKELGAEHVEVKLAESDDFEVYGTAGELDLVRSYENAVLNVTVIKESKKASTVINDLTQESIKQALNALMVTVEAAQPDPDYAFSNVSGQRHMVVGQAPNEELTLEAIKTKLAEQTAIFVQSVKEKFPSVMISDISGMYKINKINLKNTNGTDLWEENYGYQLGTVFNAVDEEKSSSFNYVFTLPKSVEEPFINNPYWYDTIARNEKELNTVPFEGRLEGNVVMTPTALADCLMDIEELALKDSAFIQDFSKWKDSIGEQVCDPKLTWHSNPLSPEMGLNFGITDDGFPAENVTVIEKGVLKSHLLSLYGAQKCNRTRSGNQGGVICIEPGDTPLNDLIAGIDKGILIGRLSGGSPSPNGDFSGIAKNSFLIEKGKITHAISEAMTTFNIFEVLKDIEALSQERHDAGMFKVPYIKSNHVLVTGK